MTFKPMQRLLPLGIPAAAVRLMSSAIFKSKLLQSSKKVLCAL
jgi:hypothetical protein